MSLTKVTYNMILGSCLNVLDYGAVGNGVADDTTALNAAIAAAVSRNKNLFIPAGTYLLTANITVPNPANTQYGFSILGEGKHNGSILQFSGSAVTTGLTFSSSVGTYQYWGTIAELQINCVSGAKRGMTFNYAHAPDIRDCQFNGATEYGLVVANANQPVVSGCLFKNNGSSGTAQVWLYYATAFSFRENYIAGSASAVSGLDIDRSPTGIVLGGAIESTGIPIRIGEAAENTVACSNINIDSVNMENPSTCYIRAGYGWTGTASLGVTSLYITNCRGFPSGGSATIGVDLKNTFATQIVSCNFGLNAGSTAVVNLNGTTNAGAIINQSRTSFGSSFPYVRLNSAVVADATPLTDWFQSTSNENILSIARSSTTSTLDNNVAVAQGGLYNSISLINAAPTTINRTANIPRINGTKLTLTALDANTTLAHLGGGGTGQFLLIGGVNLALVTNRTYLFSYNSSTGNWSQI